MESQTVFNSNIYFICHPAFHTHITTVTYILLLPECMLNFTSEKRTILQYVDVSQNKHEEWLFYPAVSLITLEKERPQTLYLQCN